MTSSETWTWLHSPVFRATPLDVKAEADRHFLQGINQLIGHGWPYTAEGIEYPGWRFYASGVFNDQNPWWHVMPDVSRYLQRLSFLLRQGQPANDVAIYLPNDDAWAHLTPGNVNLIDALRERLGPNLIPRVLEAGYNFDFFDDDSFKQIGRVEHGMLLLGANRYKAVILPAVERIPLDTLQKLEEFARGGGVLLATRRTPLELPGLQATPADHQKIVDLSHRIFEGSSTPGHFVESENNELTDKLNSSLRPDVALSPAAPEVGFIHRHTIDAEIYFVANTGNAPYRTKATFRVEGLEPDWWNPMTGKSQPATVVERSANGISMALDMEPYASRVLVFSRHARQTPPASATATTLPILDLSTAWQVTFNGTGKSVKMDRLQSWTEDESTRYYSGLATYEKSFAVPGDLLHEGVRIKLDFGEGQADNTPINPRASGMRALLEGPVHEAAVITINGRRVGSVWCPPYSIDVTEFFESRRKSIAHRSRKPGGELYGWKKSA